MQLKCMPLQQINHQIFDWLCQLLKPFLVNFGNFNLLLLFYYCTGTKFHNLFIHLIWYSQHNLQPCYNHYFVKGPSPKCDRDILWCDFVLNDPYLKNDSNIIVKVLWNHSLSQTDKHTHTHTDEQTYKSDAQANAMTDKKIYSKADEETESTPKHKLIYWYIDEQTNVNDRYISRQKYT